MTSEQANKKTEHDGEMSKNNRRTPREKGEALGQIPPRKIRTSAKTTEHKGNSKGKQVCTAAGDRNQKKKGSQVRNDISGKSTSKHKKVQDNRRDKKYV